MRKYNDLRPYYIPFAVMALMMIAVVGYKTFSGTSFDIRSQAGETQAVYKSWEFDGATTEGWLSTNLSGVRVDVGMYTAKILKNPVTLTNTAVATELPIGNKYLKLRLGVGSTLVSEPLPKNPGIMIVKTPTPSAPPAFSISVSYIPKGSTTPVVLPTVSAIADGNLYEYSILLPNIGTVTIDSVKISLSSVKSQMPIQLDWVRLVAVPLPPTPTLTPTPAPKPAIVTPSGGEIWERGKTYQISWNEPVTTASTGLFLYTRSGTADTYLGAIAYYVSNVVGTNTYLWTIPAQGGSATSPPDGNNIIVSVAQYDASGNRIVEAKSAPFTVVTPPTPTPAGSITVDTNSVAVTLDRTTAVGGLVYGPGFTITSQGATGWQIRYNEPTQGQGFYESSGGTVPGRSSAIRTYINTNKPNGVYTGSATVQYYLNGTWSNGPTVQYSITLQ